jgi:hypothetical protein
MKKLFAFVKLDFYTVLPYSVYFLAFLTFSIVFGVLSKSIFVLISFFAIGTMLITAYSFSISEKNKLETLYSVLPVSRKSAVAGRYVFTTLILLSFTVLQFIILTIMNKAYSLGFDWLEIVLLVCVMFAFALIMFSIQFPLYFAFGYNKARFMVALVIVINFTFTNNAVLDFITKHSNNIWLPVSFVIGFSVLFVVSYFVSFKLYNKKDI